MIDAATRAWSEANHHHLLGALRSVRAHLAQRAGEAEDAAAPRGADEAVWAQARPPALDALVGKFGLTPFERDVLLLCAGTELDTGFAEAVAGAVGGGPGAAPTFSLALAALPDAHWSALAPGAPLRYWRLVTVGAGAGLTGGALRIDERVLHYLTGIDTMDDQLEGFAQSVPTGGAPLAPSHRALVAAAARVWQSGGDGDGRLPLIQLCGEPEATRRIAMAAAAQHGLALLALPAHLLPAAPHELDALSRLLAREAALGGRAIFVAAGDARVEDFAREALLSHFLETLDGPVLVASREPRRLAHRAVVTFSVERPLASEQRALWEQALGSEAASVDGQLDRLVAHFQLTSSAISAASAQALAAPDRGHDAVSLADRLWQACRAQARPRLDDLVQRIEPAAAWDDLVLPVPQKQILHEVVLHVRHRATVYEAWGFAAKSSRGLGIGALFSGPSGTGKTMAAEVLAGELRLDLYRIDLSRVVSKYIGETEKNLARVFEAAEAGGAVLFFDEADALFGKRTEVRDSHDRYANIEVSYLLQRMESYRGLAILTTNLKGAIDDAFQRRIRFQVQFPFPDATQREEIWRRTLPGPLPVGELDFAKLARLSVTGGSIRNIALNAAFHAAQDGAPLDMSHLLRAARSEYTKLERPLTDGEVRGWT